MLIVLVGLMNVPTQFQDNVMTRLVLIIVLMWMLNLM